VNPLAPRVAEPIPVSHRCRCSEPPPIPHPPRLDWKGSGRVASFGAEYLVRAALYLLRAALRGYREFRTVSGNGPEWVTFPFRACVATGRAHCAVEPRNLREPCTGVGGFPSAAVSSGAALFQPVLDVLQHQHIGAATRPGPKWNGPRCMRFSIRVADGRNVMNDRQWEVSAYAAFAFICVSVIIAVTAIADQLIHMI